MSERSEKRLSEQYPGLNFNAYIPMKRLTQEEIDKYTGKKQEKENKSIAPNELIPSNVNEQEVQNDGNIENYTTQGKEDKSIAPNELIPGKVIEQEVQDDENMETNTTQGKEDKSIAPNELIPNMVISQEIQNDGNNSATNNYIPNIIIKQEIQYDVNMEEAQEMKNSPNLSNELIPVEIKQEIPDELHDDYYNNYNIVPENMSNSSMDYILNMINGSVIQNSSYMENHIPQENVNMPNSSIGFDPIRIKQEFPNRTTEIYPSQEYINKFVPNRSGQGSTQHDRNMETNTTQGKEDKSIAPNELSPGEVIEQEVQDDENMENYTTQGKEDTSIAPNELIPNMVISQEIQNEGNNSATNNYIPNIIIKQEIQYDVNMEEAQEMKNSPNLSNELIPVEIKQEIPDELHDDYYNYYNIEPHGENTFNESTNNYFPNIFNQENNYNTEMNTVPENMSNSSMDYIPIMINGSVIPNNSYMENYIPQENVNMPNSSIGFNPIRIKQEFPNRTTEIYPSQEYINKFVPNRSGQGSTQHDRNMETNTTQGKEDKSIAPNELIPGKVIEQEVQDDENMENYTTQGKEDKSIAPNELSPGEVIEQEVQDDENMETNTTQGKEDKSIAPNELSPGEVIEQEVQDDENMETNTSLRLEKKSTPSSTSGSVPNNIIIKQEILDDGNIEIYTDVLMPSMDLGYEDGTPW